MCSFSVCDYIGLFADNLHDIKNHTVPADDMGLLPDTQIAICACAGNAVNVFPVTAGYRSGHASRHGRHVCAVMHAEIAN